MKFDFTEQIRQKTDDELVEIYTNPKNYNPDFVVLAEKELANRNINVDASKQTNETVIEDDKIKLQAGKSGSPFYIFICFVFALFGGILGIYAGYIYNQSKVKSSEGETFYVYDEQTRKIGAVIMWLGIFVLLFVLLKFCFS